MSISLYDNPAGPFEAMRRGLRRERFWRSQIDRALRGLTIPEIDQRLLAAALFEVAPGGPPLASNAQVRKASRHALVDIIGDFFLRDPQRKMYLMTAAGQRGVTNLRNPQLDLVSFQRALDKTMRRHDLTGIFGFEFDVVLPREGETDHPVLAHAHGMVCSPDGKALKLKGLRERFAASRAFPGWNDGVGLHITPIGRSLTDFATVAAYLRDPFHQLKVRYPHPKHPNLLKMRATRSGYAPAIILRGTELQSQLTEFDAVFGIGEIGVSLRDQWRIALTEALPTLGRQPWLSPRIGDIAGMWQRLNGQRSELDYKSPVVITRSSSPKATDKS